MSRGFPISQIFLQAIILVGLSFIAGAINFAINPDRPAWSVAPQLEDPLAITAAEIRNLDPSSFKWVDARTSAQFEKGHLPNAFLLNEDDWEGLFEAFLIQHFDPSLTYIVYCDGGQCAASKSVANRLLESVGDLDVKYLYGGLETWERTE